eukprot:TRINITY_DN33253_c0_g1_i1.p1 TRINITY_DN33253_c0_g1~~TRINITY_DN33253_c0_g1_i1.p1  ORF type:complete len:151 (-),score=48.74 TRINITY_DN33253_c0_g1_i1:56-508(-)
MCIRDRAYATRGIPDEFRPACWRRICESMHGCRIREDEYSKLLDTHAGEVTRATQDIDRDVDRTFPSNLAFMSTCREELRRVLTAVSYRVPRIGYCQGMNFITGMLLLLLEEEDAYWAMVTIVDLSLIHISEPTRLLSISYAVFCLKKKK